VKKTASANSWIFLPKPNPQARLRLFCFPYGGGGASVFRTWPDGLPQDVEVCAIRLPGREARLREVPFTHLSQAVQTLTQILLPYLNSPFAFFGHSLGALISFELVRQLRKQNAPSPLHLFVSGQPAPQIPAPDPPIHQLPDREFIEELHCRYNGIPQAVLQNAQLMEIVLPTLRADITILETYVYTGERPLNTPISAFGGRQDKRVSQEDLAAWRDQTQNSFSLTMFAGDHFFLQSAQMPLLQTLTKNLTRLLSQPTEEFD
jgi:medium-chain acyl-[acyl-carrier-protein] hydrolase